MRQICQILGTTLGLVAVVAAGCTQGAGTDTARKAEQTQNVSSAANAAKPIGQAPQVPAGQRAPNGFDQDPPPGTVAYCPVMDTNFTVKDDSPRSVYEGKTYVLCCDPCKIHFDANPGKYI